MTSFERTARGWRKASTFQELLLKTPVSEHVPRSTTGEQYVETVAAGQVMVLRTGDSAIQALKKLSVEGFGSAPVLNEKNTFMGFITLRDLVKAATNTFFATDPDDWEDFLNAKTEFKQLTVGECIDNASIFNAVSRYASTFKESSTLTAVELLARPGIHQLAVLSQFKRVTGILTQSMVVSMIRQNMHLLTDLAGTQIWDLEKTLFKPVVCVNEGETTINAYNKMISRDISAVAVVDDDGVLQHVLSATDLKGIGLSGNNMARLFKSVKLFKTLERLDFPKLNPPTHYSNKSTPRKALYCTPEETFGDVIRKMDDGNIHRLIVCSSSSSMTGNPRPINIISQTDILTMLLERA